MISVSEINSAKYSAKSLCTTPLHALGRPKIVRIPSIPVTTATTMDDRPVWVTLGPIQRAWPVICAISHTDENDLSGSQYLNRVVSEGRVVDFDKGLSLKVVIRHEDKMYIASDPRFGIYGFGTTYAKALQDFSDFFVEFCLDIIDSDEDELAQSTLEFKKTLLAFATVKQRG